MSWDCSSNVLTTPSQEIGSFKRCYSLLLWNQDIPKHTQIGTHTSAFPTELPTTIKILGLSSCIAKDLNLKNGFGTKVFVRFTTKIISVSSKQNPYGFKSYLLIFFTKALALFYEAKKKLWRSNLLRHCNHEKKINWKISLLYNLHINRWKNSNIIYLSTQKCLPWSQANSLWCLIWIVANFLSVMGIQWKLGKEKELKINATFSAGALSEDIWWGWQGTDLRTGLRSAVKRAGLLLGACARVAGWLSRV